MHCLLRIVTAMAVGSLALCQLLPTSLARADQPSEIRVAYPGVGNGNRPFVGASTAATMHLRGMLEEEFRKDGIKVNWTFLRGAGPAVNELYANGLADFSLLGDLPSIVGKASGLGTRVLAASGIRGNTYLAVPSESSIQSIKDLKGKRVAIFKGTNIQLSVAKLLQANGLTEQDIKAINMDNATSRAALITKDVDAVFGDYGLLSLRDQGVIKLVYTTAGDPRFLRHASWVGSESFIKKYPEITKRVVKTLVAAAKWESDTDANPAPLYQLWTKSGFTFASFKEDRKGQSAKVLASPLLDPYIVDQYKHQVQDAQRFGLIKKTFDVDAWFEPRFLNEALKELSLTDFWKSIDASGNVQLVAATQH
jgi:sulfonate transport system substrate-binding protein